MPPSNRLIAPESPEFYTSCITTLRSLIGLNPSLKLSTKEPEKYYSDNDDIESISSYKNLEEKKVHFNRFDSTERITKLRQIMKQNHITCYIVPSEDEHQSEYTSVEDQRREYISGFTGSAGIAIITQTEAALFTDSRYFIQARLQLDDNWSLLKQGQDDWVEWSLNQTGFELNNFWPNVSVDPKLITATLGEFLLKKCHQFNLNLITDLNVNLIDVLIKSFNDTPVIKKSSLELYPLKYSGRSSKNKINDIRRFMIEENAFCYIINMLDSIAWTLNLRGSDIKFTPVFKSYLIIAHDFVSLYVDKSKLNEDILNYLNNEIDNINIYKYDQIWDNLPKIKGEKGSNIILDLNSNYSIFHNIPTDIYDIRFRSIVTELKGIKNETEKTNNKYSQLYDSVALVRTFSWLDSNLSSELTELDVCNKLLHFRSIMPNFRGLSFATIAGSGSNSAVVHYEPTEDEHSNLDINNILLLDSGGQYLEGTTDITRTLHLGTPSEKQIKAYSLVLAGHLNVAMLKFKKGTSSYWIDSMARQPLKRYGWDYGHGTGHGIDNYIGVHAGPCGLSPSQTSYNYKPLEEGNFLSDEPGVYFDNEFGIRIESDIQVIETADANLAFDYLSLVPFERSLIDAKYLTRDQVEWINYYHQRIVAQLTPWLEKYGDTRSIIWLRRACEELFPAKT